MPTVLIAEDDLMMADMLEEILVEAGYDVCGIARTVNRAVEIGERHKPDFAVLDLRLADGGLGTEVAAQLNRRGQMGILYATGNSRHFNLTSLDGEACIGKPFRSEDLIDALKIVASIVQTGEALKPFPRSFFVLEQPSINLAADSVSPAFESNESPKVLRLLRQQAALATFGSFALGESNLGKVLTQAARVCADGLDVPFCTVCRYRPEENDLIVEAGVGWKTGVVGRVASRADRSSPQGRAFTTGEPVICDNLNTDATFMLPSFYAEHGIISAVYVIIRKEGKPYGVLEINSPVQHDYDLHDINFLTGFANVVAEAVNTSQRNASLQSAVDQMKDMVADRDRRLAAQSIALDEKNALLGQEIRHLEENNVLGQELQHRVRNNLQLIYGMLSKQAEITADISAKAGVRAIARRVMTLTQVYDHLLGTGLSRTIEFGSYLSSLCDSFYSLERIQHPKIKLTCTCAAVFLDLDTVTALGLVVAELIANSYIHAFPHGRGLITVSLTQKSPYDGATLIFLDDGAGFVEPEHTKRHGLGLVRRLLEQLSGSATLRSDQGTEWTLKFPVPAIAGTRDQGTRD